MRFPDHLESSTHPGYVLQQDVYRYFARPGESLKAFIQRFPFKTLRLVVSKDPTRLRNFYRMDPIHKDDPTPLKSRTQQLKQHQPNRVPYRKSNLEYALLQLQDHPQFSLHRLYMFYTQKMDPRPSEAHFPQLQTRHLTPEGLKAILRRNRWPL